ncbi:MAG: hypothetical protein B5M53_07825, partial [Candidatus Cloacimonas sp. 4484_209]
FAKRAKEIGYPVLVKASMGGGGKGMRIVNNDKTLFDSYGNVIHLFERECSIQRRYQKIIEESPSVALDDMLREKMGRAAVEIAKAVGYTNAGTVEFLLDKDKNFYFLEVNARLQVEHPVTEFITGLDLVKQQILVASGEKLKITILSKLIVYAETRKDAISKIRNALKKYSIVGIKNTVSFLLRIFESSDFQKGNLSTSFIDGHKRILKAEKGKNLDLALTAFGIYSLMSSQVSSRKETNEIPSVWDLLSG